MQGSLRRGPGGGDPGGAEYVPYVTHHVLAELNIPANTSVISNSMITDRREYAETWRRPNGRSVFVRRTADQSIPSTENTDVLWDTEDFDAYGWWDSGSAALIEPGQADRRYRMWAEVKFQNSVSGDRVRLFFAENGSGIPLGEFDGDGATTITTPNHQVFGGDLIGAAGNNYRLTIFHNDTNARDIRASMVVEDAGGVALPSGSSGQP